MLSAREIKRKRLGERERERDKGREQPAKKCLILCNFFLAKLKGDGSQSCHMGAIAKRGERQIGLEIK